MVLKKHPKKSIAAGVVLSHFGLKALSRWRLETPIIKKIEEGSRPKPLPTTFVPVDRPDLEKSVYDLLHPYPKNGVEDNLFGVVIGPSGTGKTALLRKMCCRDLEGILYLEICDPRYISLDLRDAVGMIQTPTWPIDLAFTYVSGDLYAQYHKIPSDYSGVTYVLQEITKHANQFKSKHGRMPALVIDGIDLVATKDETAFLDLVDRAKFFANSGIIKLVFVSSEGSVVPLLGKTSSTSRLAHVLEILDIPNKEAVNLLSNKMPKELTE